MLFAGAYRDWLRFRRGECDLLPATYQFAFASMTLSVVLSVVFETACFLFGWPTIARQDAPALAGMYLLWAGVAVWRTIHRRMTQQK